MACDGDLFSHGYKLYNLVLKGLIFRLYDVIINCSLPVKNANLMCSFVFIFIREDIQTHIYLGIL